MKKLNYFYLTESGSVVYAPTNAVQTVGEKRYFERRNAQAFISTPNKNVSEAKRRLLEMVEEDNEKENRNEEQQEA